MGSNPTLSASNVHIPLIFRSPPARVPGRPSLRSEIPGEHSFRGFSSPALRGVSASTDTPAKSQSSELVVNAAANNVEMIGACARSHGCDVEIFEFCAPVRCKSPLGAAARTSRRADQPIVHGDTGPYPSRAKGPRFLNSRSTSTTSTLPMASAATILDDQREAILRNLSDDFAGLRRAASTGSLIVSGASVEFIQRCFPHRRSQICSDEPPGTTNIRIQERRL